MEPGGITRDEFREELSLHEDRVRLEFDSKMDSLKWRMIAALLGGQVLAGLMAAFVTTSGARPADYGAYALRLLGLS